MRYTVLLAAAALLTAGCAKEINVNGRWVGTWSGIGVANITRTEAAAAEFYQDGESGRGRFRISGSNAAEVPPALTHAGDAGVPVYLAIDGETLVVRHAIDSRLMNARFKVDGDQMVGRLIDSPGPVSIRLVRAGTPGHTVSQQKVSDVRKELARERDRVAELKAQVEKAMRAAESASAAAADAQARAAEAATRTTERSSGDGQPSATPGLAPIITHALGIEHRREMVATLDVTFGFDRWELDARAEAALSDLVDRLKTNPTLMADLEGYTDSFGTKVYNLGLSQRRVNSVHRFLVQKGVPLTQIHVVGMGLIPGRGSREEQAPKRRVTVKLMSITPN